MKLEQIFSSSCRRRILSVLEEIDKTHVMDLVRQVNSTYTQVNPNLKTMEKEGIISEMRISNMRIIKLNRENPKTELLLQALKILNPQPFTNSNNLFINQLRESKFRRKFLFKKEGLKKAI